MCVLSKHRRESDHKRPGPRAMLQRMLVIHCPYAYRYLPNVHIGYLTMPRSEIETSQTNDYQKLLLRNSMCGPLRQQCTAMCCQRDNGEQRKGLRCTLDVETKWNVWYMPRSGVSLRIARSGWPQLQCTASSTISRRCVTRDAGRNLCLKSQSKVPQNAVRKSSKTLRCVTGLNNRAFQSARTSPAVLSRR